MDCDPETLVIVSTLAQYLRVNPLACDTADGICRWWLGEDPATAEKLVQALDWMKRHGLVEELMAADGRLRYRRRATDAQLQATIDARGSTSMTRH